MRNYNAHTCVGVGAHLLGITQVGDTPYNNNIILLCLANSILLVIAAWDHAHRC